MPRSPAARSGDAAGRTDRPVAQNLLGLAVGPLITGLSADHYGIPMALAVMPAAWVSRSGTARAATSATAPPPGRPPCTRGPRSEARRSRRSGQCPRPRCGSRPQPATPASTRSRRRSAPLPGPTASGSGAGAAIGAQRRVLPPQPFELRALVEPSARPGPRGTRPHGCVPGTSGASELIGGADARFRGVRLPCVGSTIPPDGVTPARSIGVSRMNTVDKRVRGGAVPSPAVPPRAVRLRRVCDRSSVGGSSPC